MWTVHRSDRMGAMNTPELLTYRHRLAVEGAPWLLDVLNRALTSYVDSLGVQQEVTQSVYGSSVPITRELCYAHAALEQIVNERAHHAGHRTQPPHQDR